MILNRKPLSLAEANAYIKPSEEKKPIEDYMKKFAKAKKDDAEKMRAEILALNNIKIKEEQIVKLIDLLPEDTEDLNKIFVDATLSEEEANALLAILKKY